MKTVKNESKRQAKIEKKITGSEKKGIQTSPSEASDEINKKKMANVNESTPKERA